MRRWRRSPRRIHLGEPKKLVDSLVITCLSGAKRPRCKRSCATSHALNKARHRRCTATRSHAQSYIGAVQGAHGPTWGGIGKVRVAHASHALDIRVHTATSDDAHAMFRLCSGGLSAHTDAEREARHKSSKYGRISCISGQTEPLKTTREGASGTQEGPDSWSRRP